MEAHKEIELLLGRYMGLHPSSIGSEAFDRALRRRMAECDLSDIREYLKLLHMSPPELGELCEEIVVLETWFFRDGEPFTFLKRHILTQWLPKHRNSVLRVLSIPCSTGEEPYSVAMTLLDVGLNPLQFHIDAVDISPKALLNAGRALYTRNSFRGDDLSYRQCHFDEKEHKYKLHDTVRNTVHFMWGNLADPHFLVGRPPYHVIFCRNLLIYFDTPTRERAFNTFGRLLVNSGLLFLGHTEILQAPTSAFRPVRHPRSFACYKVADRSMIEPCVNKSPDKASLRFPVNIGFSSPALEKGADGMAPGAGFLNSSAMALPDEAPDGEALHPEEPAGSPSQLLDTAAGLADRGRLDEAAALCRKAILEGGASARAYLLLGLIREGTGDARSAEEYFNKAVYLAPDHYEALIHLALLAERRGDVSAASLFRKRAERAYHGVVS